MGGLPLLRETAEYIHRRLILSRGLSEGNLVRSLSKCLKMDNTNARNTLRRVAEQVLSMVNQGWCYFIRFPKPFIIVYHKSWHTTGCWKTNSNLNTRPNTHVNNKNPQFLNHIDVVRINVLKFDSHFTKSTTDFLCRPFQH